MMTESIAQMRHRVLVAYENDINWVGHLLRRFQKKLQGLDFNDAIRVYKTDNSYKALACLMYRLSLDAAIVVSWNTVLQSDCNPLEGAFDLIATRCADKAIDIYDNLGIEDERQFSYFEIEDNEIVGLGVGLFGASFCCELYAIAQAIVYRATEIPKSEEQVIKCLRNLSYRYKDFETKDKYLKAKMEISQRIAELQRRYQKQIDKVSSKLLALKKRIEGLSYEQALEIVSESNVGEDIQGLYSDMNSDADFVYWYYADEQRRGDEGLPLDTVFDDEANEYKDSVWDHYGIEGDDDVICYSDICDDDIAALGYVINADKYQKETTADRMYDLIMFSDERDAQEQERLYQEWKYQVDNGYPGKEDEEEEDEEEEDNSDEEYVLDRLLQMNPEAQE